jgi:D-alanyl-D-alanine carboxypeptidase
MVMKQRRRLVFVLFAILAAFLVVAGFLLVRRQPSDQIIQQSQGLMHEEIAFDKSQHSLDLPTSPWVVVNKRRPLNPVDFAPQLATPQVGLRLGASNPEMQVSQQITPAVEQLFAAAKQDGLDLIIASGYRSYKTQATVYNNEVKRNGQQAADRESARPGHSEHQTGLAVDIGAASRECEIESCFGDMAEGKWLAANAYKYGFIIRYDKEDEAVTGYTYEPWHLRYVGAELARELHRQGNPPLESFFSLGAAPDYQ